MHSILAVTFNTETSESAQNFLQFLLSQINHTNYFHMIDDMEGMGTDGNTRLFVNTTIHITIESNQISDVIDQVNYLLNNVASGQEKLYEELLTGYSVNVLIEDSLVSKPVSELLHSLQKRVQSLEHITRVLIRNNNHVTKKLEEKVNEVSILQSKYEGIQSYLEDGIEIKTLRDIIIDLALSVDPEIITNRMYKKAIIQ